MRKIAIVGSSPSSCDLAPWADQSWEIWGLAWRDMPRATRLFEIHDPARWPRYTGPDYLARLQRLQGLARLYVRAPIAELAQAIVYPAADVLRCCSLVDRPADIFTSSVAFMLGLALLETDPDDRVGIFGVDMSAEDEWAYQRPAVEYLIGLATGRGIAVDIPPQSSLCRANFVYGVGDESPTGRAAGITETVLQQRIGHYLRDRQATQERMNNEIARLQTIDGHLAEDRALLDLVRHFNRGGVIPGIGAPSTENGS